MISILIIGNEILSSQVDNSNLRHMLHSFAEHNLTVDEVRIVRDCVAAIKGAINELRAASQFVISSGGLGPTHDDVTMKAYAEAFQVSLTLHPELERRMRKHFGDRLKPAHLTMAMLPENAQLIDTGAHRFPLVQVGNCFALPGLPELFLEKLDFLITRLPGGPTLFYAEILTHAAETTFAESLAHASEAYPDVEIGSYPKFDRSDFSAKITLKASNETSITACYEDLVTYFQNAGLFLSARQPAPYEPMV